MNIEFLGLPGSGKTTARKLLLEKLKTMGQACVSAEESYYHVTRTHGDKLAKTVLRLLPRKAGLVASEYFQGRSLFQTECQSAFLAEHGQSLEAYLSSSVFPRMSLADRQNVIGNYLAMGSLWSMLTHSRSPMTFFEEGFIQKSLMFVDHNLPQDDALKASIEKYLHSVPLPEIAIYIKASTRNSHQRMHLREDGLTNRLKSCDPATIDAFLETTEQHFESILPILNKTQHCTVIEANNNGDLSTLVSNVAKSIINHARQL